MSNHRLTAGLDWFERIITIILIGMMAAVVVLATAELGWILIKDVLTPPVFLLEIEELRELFGLFLLVLIGIELLHSARTYLLHRQVHLQAVLAVALIAIASKIVDLGPGQNRANELAGPCRHRHCAHPGVLPCTTSE